MTKYQISHTNSEGDLLDEVFTSSLEHALITCHNLTIQDTFFCDLNTIIHTTIQDGLLLTIHGGGYLTEIHRID